MRSKASAPLREVVKETNAGYKVYMHGKRDTYNMRNANHFIWENIGATPTDMNANDYQNMYAFWKGMNAFRLSEYGKVFRVSEKVPKAYYRWILPKTESALGYIVDEKVFVLLNPGSKEYEFENIDLPEGNWKLIANTQEANHTKGVKDNKKTMKLSGAKIISVLMEAESLRIWVKE